MPNLARYPDFDTELPDSPLVASFLRDVKTNFQSGSFTPTYTGLTGVVAAYGRFQRIGSIVFVHYKIGTTTYTVAAGDVLKLPFKPLQGTGALAGTNQFPQPFFAYGQLGTNATQNWYMDTTSQYIRCPSAIGSTTAAGFTVSGWYLVE